MVAADTALSSKSLSILGIRRNWKIHNSIALVFCAIIFKKGEKSCCTDKKIHFGQELRKSRLYKSKLKLSKQWNCFLNHEISCAGSVKTKQQLWRQFPQGPFHKRGNMGKSSEFAAHNHHRRTLPL